MGKDVSTFNLHRASEEAANFQKNKLIKAYLTTGSLLQRRHVLKLFLTDERMVKDTKSNLVKWTQVPLELLPDEIIMVENTMTTVFRGDWICEGRWLNRVERARYWYMVGDTVVTVRMKNDLHADLAMTPISVNNPLPRLHPTVRDQVVLLNPHKMQSIDHDFMMDEISRRDAMNFEEEVISSDNDTGSDGDEDSDDDISDDDDDANDGND